MSGESSGKVIVTGLGIGFFFAIFLSLYVSNFTSLNLPIWLVYGILAPFISALSIAGLIYSSKERRDRYMVDYWQETEELEKERESRM